VAASAHVGRSVAVRTDLAADIAVTFDPFRGCSENPQPDTRPRTDPTRVEVVVGDTVNFGDLQMRFKGAESALERPDSVSAPTSSTHAKARG